MGGIGGFEMMLFGIVALLLYGSRLPEVARNLGGTYRGLKRSVDEFKREFESIESYEPKRTKQEPRDDEDTGESSAPRFTPPPKDS